MAVVKKAVSFDPEIWADLKHVAEAEHLGVSTVINRALRHELRIRSGLAAVAEWEAEHGVLTAEELAQAERTLDLSNVRTDVADQAQPA